MGYGPTITHWHSGYPQYISTNLKYMRDGTVPGTVFILRDQAEVIPTAPPSQAWSNITEGTLILNITLVGQGFQAQGLKVRIKGSTGHMTSDGRCDIEALDMGPGRTLADDPPHICAG